MSAQVQTFGGCSVLPANNVWNVRVDNLPVDANSSAYVNSMNATNTKLHPDFGHGTVLTGGMPYNLVPGTQPKVPVKFYYNGDPGPYPIPANVNIQPAGDHHSILVDTTNCVDYELFNLQLQPDGTWLAGSGAIFPLNSNALRTNGWTSADASGLAILPGLIRYDEVASGRITHALRFTADHTQKSHIWPARHDASSLTGTQYPPMGQRFRLKAAFDISRFPQPVQVILQALKTYGMILTDNGTSWHLQGIGDERWDDTVMHNLTWVVGNNFEAINESSLMMDPNSAQVRMSTDLPTGWVNLVSKNSNKCLDMIGGPLATQPTAAVQQWTCLGTAQTNQQFQLKPVTGGYEIVVKSSGLALEVITSTGVVEQWPFGSQPYQIWSINATGDGYYTLKPTSTKGACLDVGGASKADGAHIQEYTCSGSDNQKWAVVPMS